MPRYTAASVKHLFSQIAAEFGRVTSGDLESCVRGGPICFKFIISFFLFIYFFFGGGGGVGMGIEDQNTTISGPLLARQQIAIENNAGLNW